MNVGSNGLQHLQVDIFFKNKINFKILVFKSLDGFFFLLSSDGKILFISENSINYVGYSQVRYQNKHLGFVIYNRYHM